jgi:hypothetical protein
MCSEAIGNYKGIDGKAGRSNLSWTEIRKYIISFEG